MDAISDILKKHTASGEDTRDKILGAAAIVVNKNGILYSGAAGRNDIPVDSTPFTVDSFGWITALTKLVTVTAVMQLVDEGRITLDQDVRDVVPELNELKIIRGFKINGTPIVEKNTSPVTVRHLLTHTMGMSYTVFGTPELHRYNQYISRTFATISAHTKESFTEALIFAPGEGWAYGPSVDWAGQVVERISGKSLDVYMKERIFDPLGMKSTAFFPEVPEAAKGHETILATRGRGSSIVAGIKVHPQVQEFKSGGGGLYSTASDYAAFLLALIQGKIVKEATLDEMFTPQLNEMQRTFLQKMLRWESTGFTPWQVPMSHGLGGPMNLEDVPGGRKAGSMAWSGGSNPRWWIDRKAGIAGVLFVNQWPFGDHVVTQLWKDLEKTVYKAL